MESASESRPCFFNSGVMRASFISWGNTPEERDKLIMFAIEGANVGRHFFRTNVGNGSRDEDLDAHDNIETKFHKQLLEKRMRRRQRVVVAPVPSFQQQRQGSLGWC